MDWQALTELTQGRRFTVERVRLVESGIAIEGTFEPPALARLSAEDQVFVMAFVSSHGSLREMERLFGISYPTVKRRLERIAGQLDLVETRPAPSVRDLLDRIEAGEMSADDALEEMGR